MYFLYFIYSITFSCNNFFPKHSQSVNTLKCQKQGLTPANYQNYPLSPHFNFKFVRSSSLDFNEEIKHEAKHKKINTSSFDKKFTNGIECNSTNQKTKKIDVNFINSSNSLSSIGLEYSDGSVMSTDISSSEDCTSEIEMKRANFGEENIVKPIIINKKSKLQDLNGKKKEFMANMIKLFIIVYLIPGIFIFIFYCFISSTIWVKMINYMEVNFRNDEALYLQLKRAYKDFFVYLNEKKLSKCEIRGCECYADINEKQMNEMWNYNI